MRGLLTVFILLVTFAMLSQKVNPNYKIATNKYLKKSFTKNEIEFLEEIMRFYDNLMLSYSHHKEIDSAYLYYLKDIVNSSSEEDWDTKTAFGKLKVDLFIEQHKSKQIFNKLFEKAEYTNNDTTKITGDEYAPNFDGAFFDLLDCIIKNEKTLKKHKTSIRAMGTIPPATFAGMFKFKDKFNFNDELIRLYYAIVFINFKSVTDFRKERNKVSPEN